MLKLEQTEKILRGLVDAGWMGSYALFVRHGSEKAAITSKNADADTLFEVASLTKVTVTAPLAMMSIAEGKLALEDQLGDFFSGLTVMRDVTVFRLLTHTSGIGAIPFSFVLTDRGSQAVAAAICRARPDYAPGTDQQYSCMGFITLGAILEQIYGKTLDVLFAEKLAGPLELTRSRFCVSIGEENTVVSYRRDEPGEYGVDDENAYFMRGVSGNAGAFWSISDLEKLADAIYEKRLYPAGLAEMAERSYTDGFPQKRGLGYLIIDEDDPLSGGLFPAGSFGHCGYTGTSLFFSRERELYVALLTNSARFAYRESPTHEHVRGRTLAMRRSVHAAVAKDLGL